MRMKHCDQRTSPSPAVATTRSAATLIIAVLLATVGVSTLDAQHPTPSPTRNHPTMLVRTTPPEPGAVAALLRDPRVDVLHACCPRGATCTCPRPHVEALIYPADFSRIDSLGFKPVIVHHDIEAFIAARNGSTDGQVAIGLGSMGGFYTLAEVITKLDGWRTKYPSLITARRSIGKSIENRDLWAVTISTNADVDENEPEILLHTLIHAREPGGLMAMMNCVEYLLENYGKDPVVTDLLDNREIHYIPVANPDGYEYNRRNNPEGGGAWRKNRRWSSGSTYGVDLNRNFGYQWGYDNRGSSSVAAASNYRGTAAWSEPETAALGTFARSRVAHGLTSVWDIHCAGALLMWPFSYTLGTLSVREATYGVLVPDMASRNNYRTGRVPTLLYPANGSSIDFYDGAVGVFSVAPELGTNGDSFWPPITRVRPLAEENLDMLIKGIQAAGPYLRVQSRTVREIGNNNQHFEAGERVEVVLSVRNMGVLDANAARLRLRSSTPWSVVEVGTANLGDVVPLATASNSVVPLRARILSMTPPGTALGLTVEIEFNGHRLAVPLDIVCGPSRTLVSDDCETATWVRGVAGDTATSGVWTWGDPNPTYATNYGLFTVQPGDDHTPTGKNCYMTGNSPSVNADANDVDGGTTTLVTRPLPLGGARDPHVSYWRYYMDHGPNPNSDPFVVEVTNDGTTWVEVERVVRQTQAWIRHTFRLRDFVEPTPNVRLRFIAVDNPDDSFCEALIDDLLVVDYDDGVSLALTGSTSVGQTANLELTATRSAGRHYATAVAFSNAPGIPLPASGRVIPLATDALLWSYANQPSVFQSFVGELSTSGTATSHVEIPRGSSLVGTEVYAAFITLDAAAPDGVRDVSRAVMLRVAP